MYRLIFDEKWDEYFDDLPPDIKIRVLKKLEQIKNGLPGRHLEHGVPIFAEEIGQYRICYTEDKNNMTRTIYFAGKHKDYDKWLKGFR